MIYEIWCNGKLHYTRPEGHPDVQEALDLIERTKRLFGVSAYEVRAQQSVQADTCRECGNRTFKPAIIDPKIEVCVACGTRR